MKKSLSFYFAVILVFLVGMFLTMQHGRHLPRSSMAPSETLVSSAVAVGSASPTTVNLTDPFCRLLIQILVILVVSWGVAFLFIKLGQPAVVGQMFAGVLLGPSMLGWLFPHGFEVIFPVASLGTLKLVSQIGVCLFMFVVGMELDVKHLRNRAHAAIIVSHTSILLPYLLGVVAALGLFPALAGPGVSFVSFALFMGIAMSITAFPVLARILQERNLEKTPLGGMAITCAAIGDASAWCLLAFVVAFARSSGVTSTLLTLVLVAVFAVVMLRLIRPRAAAWLGVETGKSPDSTVLVAVIIFMLGSALVTELMGIHALFGAFLAGVVMPAKIEFRDYLKVRIESFSSIFLLPLFFAFIGLRTQMGLMNVSNGWMICLGIILVATVGKLGGSMLAARMTGMSWDDSFALGALMNTRGLMELIAINMGYDLGILSREVFAMLILMALATTFMTGPLLSFGDSLKARRTVGSMKTL